MKKILFGLFCLSAICAASAQYVVWTPEMITAREGLLKQAYEWIVELDSAYFNYYTAAKDRLESLISLYQQEFDDFKNIFETIPQEQLSEDLSKNFTDFFVYLNTTNENVASSMPSSLGMMTSTMGMGMMSFGLTSIASGFQQTMSMDLNSVIVDFGVSPSSSSCRAYILNTFNSIYESYKLEHLEKIDLQIKYMGNPFKEADLSFAVFQKQNQDLVAKMQNCQGKLTEELIQCIQEIVDEYANCKICTYKNDFSVAYGQLSLAGSYLYMNMGGMGAGGLGVPYSFSASKFLKGTCPQ